MSHQDIQLVHRVFQRKHFSCCRFNFNIYYRSENRSFLSAYQNSWILDASVGLWNLKAGLWTLDTVLGTLDATLEARLWMLDSGRWALDVELWKLDTAHWTLGSVHWTLLLTGCEQNQIPISDSAWLNYWNVFACKSLRTSWSR